MFTIFSTSQYQQITNLLYSVQNKQNALSQKITVLGQQLDNLVSKLNLLATTEGKIMATLNQVLQSVTDESTLEDSIIALLDGIKAQLAAALAGTTLPSAVQAQIDTIFNNVEANKAKVAAAVAANTPAAP